MAVLLRFSKYGFDLFSGEIDLAFHRSLYPPQSHFGKSHSLLGSLCQDTEWLHLHIGGIFIGSTFMLGTDPYSRGLPFLPSRQRRVSACSSSLRPLGIF